MIGFQKPGDPAELAVDLCNTWDTLEEDPELLRDVAALRRFLDRHGLAAEAEVVEERDLERVRSLRDGLRAAFVAGDDGTAVELLNGIAAGAGAVPRLERSGSGWPVRRSGKRKAPRRSAAAMAISRPTAERSPWPPP